MCDAVDTALSIRKTLDPTGGRHPEPDSQCTAEMKQLRHVSVLGVQPVGVLRTLAPLLLAHSEDHLHVAVRSVRSGYIPCFAITGLVRASLESASRLAYLLHAGLDSDGRLARVMNESLHDLQQLESVRLEHRKGRLVEEGYRMLEETALGAGLVIVNRNGKRMPDGILKRGRWVSEVRLSNTACIDGWVNSIRTTNMPLYHRFSSIHHGTIQGLLDRAVQTVSLTLLSSVLPLRPSRTWN